MSTLHTAGRGVQQSHQKAAAAADEIARAGGMDTVSISGDTPRREPDVVRGMVDLRVARYQQTANLAVMRTAGEMSEELVDALG